MGDDNHPDILAIDLNTISETGTMPRDMTGTGRQGARRPIRRPAQPFARF